MTKLQIILIKAIGLFIMLCAAVLDVAGQSPAGAISGKEKKTLIVYLSRTGNTKGVAEIIQCFAGGQMVSLELEKSYPADSKKILAQVRRENEENVLPKLKTRIANVQAYVLVFLGTPTWNRQFPPPCKNLFNKYDYAANDSAFNTDAGYGLRSGFKIIRKLSPGAQVLQGLPQKPVLQPMG